MFGINWRWTATIKRLASSFMAAVFIWGLAGCASPMTELPKVSPQEPSAPVPARTISEVSPPQTIQELRQSLEIYQPQVKILSPRPGEVLEDNTVTVKFQVQDLPIYKDVNLGLGPHLHVFLDNQPYTAVYDANEPLVLSDLEPGTHTLRAFASRPWHESFKNEGAYAQTTFHLFTKTPNNNPDPALPLLTYSRPQSSYGAEPIMLDFYLTNAPLHQVALENPADAIVDWRIRVTINGESFVTDQWQPLYLTGFKPGKNWVQLEFLDEEGNPLNNVFNNTVRLITYEPNGQDTLSKLVRGELTAAEAGSIVDPNYSAKPPLVEPVEAPTTTPISEPSAEPALTSEPEVTPTDGPVPTVEVTPATPVPTVEGTPKTEVMTPEGETPETKSAAPEAEPAANEAATPKTGVMTPESESPKVEELLPVT